jgi:hypothetical protein
MYPGQPPSLFRAAVSLVLYLASGFGAAPAWAGGVRFFAVGDLPYAQSETAPLMRLLGSAAAERPPFVVHVGDIKGGGAPCSDTNLAEIAALFRAQPLPVVYTPGDNEWTDCHRPSAGGQDPLARLERIRETFFADPAVLRMAELNARSPVPLYPETAYFVRNAVLFVVLHIVGSNNGASLDRPAVDAERVRRDAANRVTLERALASTDADALVLIFHANPLFEARPGPPGFRAFKALLAETLERFSGPVLALHGDTHRFRHDQPLAGALGSDRSERLVRVEVPGAPLVGGVWIRVEPDSDQPFGVAPVYAVTRDSLYAD